MTRAYVPPSGEVIAEEIQEKLAESIPRDEQGGFIRDFVRLIADEIAKVAQTAHKGVEP